MENPAPTAPGISKSPKNTPQHQSCHAAAILILVPTTQIQRFFEVSN